MSFWDSEVLLGEFDKGSEKIFVKRVLKRKPHLHRHPYLLAGRQR